MKVTDLKSILVQVDPFSEYGLSKTWEKIKNALQQN